MKLLYGFKDAILNYNYNLVEAELCDVISYIAKSKSEQLSLSIDHIYEQYITQKFKYELLLAYSLATISDNLNYFVRI